jgi:hypothetical protein
MNRVAKAIVLVVSVIAVMAGYQLVSRDARTPDIILLALGAFGVGASITRYVMTAAKN